MSEKTNRNQSATLGEPPKTTDRHLAMAQNAPAVTTANLTDHFICLNSDKRSDSPKGVNVEHGIRIDGSEYRLQLMTKIFGPSAHNKNYFYRLGDNVSYHGDEAEFLNAQLDSARAFLKGKDYLSTGWQIVEIVCLQSRPFIDGSERQCSFAFEFASGDHTQVDNVAIRGGFVEQENPDGYWGGACVYMPEGATIGESIQVSPEVAERMKREARAYEASKDAYRPYEAMEAGEGGAVMQAEETNAGEEI